MNNANVIGTAIGRYLIRNSDPQPAQRKRTKQPHALTQPPPSVPAATLIALHSDHAFVPSLDFQHISSVR
jgi:hypothetical protein